ncbi:MAG: hypothetical protein IJR14_08340 [Synergistaceae bacterium]|nr:hypothetical protein [Synergistaceae bacterium]
MVPKGSVAAIHGRTTERASASAPLERRSYTGWTEQGDDTSADAYDA